MEEVMRTLEVKNFIVGNIENIGDSVGVQEGTIGISGTVLAVYINSAWHDVTLDT